jgi:cysteine desulfurase
VPAIVGFGAAAQLTGERRVELAERLQALRAKLEPALRSLGAAIFGEGAPRIPNTTYFAFRHIDGETLVVELDKLGFAVAAGAACSSASTEPSATLIAMDIERELARGAVRLSLGAGNTEKDIERFVQALKGLVQRLRALTAMAV